ncbi:type IV pilus secretin PilQ [Marinicella gelatinilytica]|uniref:type IV pilus secretin PilQ n=1 Tax=Marinicella gelatinilytica TaxID=2996017 RepID=UPI002260BF3C|nr:type IV pilus secretin PilQ [Marinicella gelatinilytica]MCX7544671.1 type IV pilus secretin PilQ [Marinicella gelatinilytica]
MCFLVSQANAQSAIEDVSLSSGENGVVEISFEFSGPVAEPKVFSTNLPPRLALDFENTKNNSDMDNQSIGIGQAKGLRIVSAGSKTRAVIDLTGPSEHSIKTENNVVVVTVMPGDRYVQQSRQQAVVINDIDFRRGEDGQAVVQLGLTDPNAIINISENMDKVVIEIANANLEESLDLKMDVIDFATPVKYVDARQRGSDVKIELEAKGAFDKMAYQTGNRYTVEISEKQVDTESKSRLLEDEIEYNGHLVSFNFQDIAVRSLLQLIADASQLNIVVADSVQGSVTLRLNNVPWDQALDIVLRSKQLDQRRRGDVIWVAPASEIAELEQKKMEAFSKKQELEPLDNIFIQVNYAKAEDLANLINGESAGQGGGGSGGNKLLSDRGSVAFDERTNTLLVTDVPDRLRVIQNLVETLDRSVQQVQIESRIVVASEKFGDELGVRFGVTGSHEDRYGNIISTGGSAAALDRMNNAALVNRYNSPSGSGLPTVTPDDELSSPIAGPPMGERLNVNLPAAASSAGRWAMSILAADYLLDLELSALESEDRGEVISSPRVITANQTQAVIQQGVQIPYEEATSSGATSIQFKDATLSLEVTPLITPDDRVDLTLSVKQDAIGQEVSTALGGSVPSIDTRSVQTRVLVSNGQTVVLGGIYEQVRRTTRSKVPVLGDIPGLGALFRNKAVQDDKAELLIFVTPTIIKESL